jgi:hypothetical protein
MSILNTWRGYRLETPKNDNNQPQISQIESNATIKKSLIVMAICVGLIYFINNIVYTYVPFIPNDISAIFWNTLNKIYNHGTIAILTSDFAKCLWAINLVVFTALLGYFSFLLYNPDWYKRFINCFICVLAIIALYVLFRVFPFNIESAFLVTILQAGLIIFAAISLIVLLLQVIKRNTNSSR